MSISGLLGLTFVLTFALLIGGIRWFIVGQRRQPLLREIEAFRALPYRVGLAVEAGRRLHISLGTGSIGGTDSAAALAGLSVLERLAGAATTSDQPPIVTTGDGVTMLLAQDALRRIYRRRNVIERYDHDSARLAGATPFSYAAGVMTAMRDESVATSLLIGHFEQELPLIVDAGVRTDVHQVAGTDHPPSQALPYVTADHALIGEDMFAAGAYVSGGQPTHVASLLAQDSMRALIIVAIFVGVVLRTLGIIP